MQNRSRFQERAIKNFYNNREDIAVQRAQELITELYLTEGKKRAQHWKNLVTHLLALGAPQAQIDQLVEQDNPEQVANYLKTLLKK